ncbi:MAG: DUF401 family protein [Kiritimatiellae bacterium]|nr:DUF401 family protein [Kiritimatiellia bacterium]
MPAVPKILIVFIVTLAITRVKVPLGLALILGGLALALWAGKSVTETSVILGAGVVGIELWLMLAITALVLEFGRFITEPENSKEILKIFHRVGGNRGKMLSLMGAPALVGLIPMPAGALFSAPLVKETVGDGDLSDDWQAGINYWFRHIWEYWWPLYPGVIIAMSLFTMETWQFFAVQIPFTLFAAISGYLFMIRPHAEHLSVKKNTVVTSLRQAGLALLPLFIVVIGVLVIPSLLELISPDIARQNKKMLSMLLGLLFGLIVIIRLDHKRGRKGVVFSSLREKKSLSILVTIAGVMLFKHCLEYSGLIVIASQEMGGSNLGLVCIVAGLPLLAGLITGVAMGFTGASLPLIVGLTAGPDSGMGPAATLVLAYGCGYMGMMLSPVHLCLLVSKDYFETSLFQIIRRIIPCVIAVLLYAVGGHILFRLLGW